MDAYALATCSGLSPLKSVRMPCEMVHVRRRAGNLYLHGGSRFSACEPDPGPALVDGAVAFEDLYIDKFFTERFLYLFRRECRCPYDFCEQFMSVVPLELQLDIPVEHCFGACSYPHTEIVLTELLDCLRDTGNDLKVV